MDEDAPSLDREMYYLQGIYVSLCLCIIREETNFSFFRHFHQKKREGGKKILLQIYQTWETCYTYASCTYDYFPQELKNTHPGKCSEAYALQDLGLSPLSYPCCLSFPFSHPPHCGLVFPLHLHFSLHDLQLLNMEARTSTYQFPLLECHYHLFKQ